MGVGVSALLCFVYVCCLNACSQINMLYVYCSHSRIRVRRTSCVLLKFVFGSLYLCIAEAFRKRQEAFLSHAATSASTAHKPAAVSHAVVSSEFKSKAAGIGTVRRAVVYGSDGRCDVMGRDVIWHDMI